MSDARDALLVFEDLHVEFEAREVVRGVSLAVHAGEKQALLGRSGSGKSSLVKALMGHPRYDVTAGRIDVRGEDVTGLPADERARRGMFLAFQDPVELPGVTVANFVRSALHAHRGAPIPVGEFRRLLMEQLAWLGVDPGFAGRYVNRGFSCSDKKRLEALQLAVLEPRVILLDETDDGLDLEALRTVADGIRRSCGESTAVLLVTHETRLLHEVEPDRVHLLVRGKIVRSGGLEVARELEQKGYERVEREALERS
ncbi:MAG: Fe-S cluster assembly ATPase SufC [Candidatus Krumholzibacteriia bacterium]